MTDTLLQSLVWLTRHHGRERSAESLLAGQPVTEALTPTAALRVLHDAGWRAGVIERPLAQIHPLQLPAILLLADGSACVLTRREAGHCEIVLPGQPPGAVAEPELAACYGGYVLVATPQPAAATADTGPAGHWLWGTLRRFAPYYRSALLAALLTNVLTLVLGLVTAITFDKVIPHQAFTTMWALASGAFVALVFDLVARQLRSHLIDRAGKKADLLIGARLFRQTLDVRMEHRPASAGSYAHQLAQVETVRDFTTSATLSALTDLPFVLLFVAMIFVIAGPLGWVMVVAIPVILGIAAAIQGALRRTMRAQLDHQAEQQGVLVEAIEGLEDLKTSGAQGRFVRRYEEATAAAADTALRSRQLTGWTNHLAGAAQQLVTLVMLVWGVYLIDDQLITGGALIGAVMFAGRAIGPLSSVVSLATRWQGARAAMATLNRLMSLPVEREPGRRFDASPAISGRLALANASFAYPATGDAPAPAVLKGLSLKVEPGERVAILGRIGSGKSTVLRLLAGLYEPTEGCVEVDGIDLRQIDPADYRARVGFVSQEPRLFKGTLRENVTMGRAAVDAERLAEVARVTGLDRLVAGHPQGWELPVGEMGGLLSGGQRQLVALARCLALQPQILLMDEPTSSMDVQSELGFLKQLKDAAAGRTLVAVTHRPAVLELVDRVVVVDGGQVLIDGPKAVVLAKLQGLRAADAAPRVHLHPAAAQRAATV
ncbi:MAG TPA: type I secretion system permease/ATPase [Methylibium sp.]|nr:type I secretion system permease/ATPase [Methylibium sp.]